MLIRLLAIPLIGFATATVGQQVGGEQTTVSNGIFVTTADVRDCPYNLIKVVAGNKRTTMLQKPPSFDDFAEEVSEKAAKLGADAVVLVSIGEPRMTMVSPRSYPMSGRAIKFVDRNCAPRHQLEANSRNR